MLGQRREAVKFPAAVQELPDLDSVITTTRNQLLHRSRICPNKRAWGTSRGPGNRCHSNRMGLLDLGFFP